MAEEVGARSQRKATCHDADAQAANAEEDDVVKSSAVYLLCGFLAVTSAWSSQEPLTPEYRPQAYVTADAGPEEEPLVRAQVRALDLVRDDAGVLSEEQHRNLTMLLQDVQEQTGIRVLVVLVPTTAPDSSERYGGRLVEYWARRGAVDPAQTVIAVLEVNDRYLSVLAGHGLPALQRELASGGALKFLVPYLKEQRYYEAMVALAQWLSRRIPAPSEGGRAAVPGRIPLEPSAARSE